ncbi:GNAT family N-acetyltransferase [Mucilaginibacter sp.]|uniref:GNAT family N-acetyltransferase n=1 Tax=Mucilaginibacter sp. TaxID=1882438 RepID=UPI0031B645EE
MSNVLFESDNLRMRRFLASDKAFVFELLNTPAWKKFIGDRNIHTLVDALNYIQKGPLSLYEKYGFGPWIVELKFTEDVIGMCGLFKRDYLDQPDLGFAFLPGYEGRGLAYEACIASLSYIKSNYTFDKLYAITTDDNVRSRRLLERCGFLNSGTIISTEGEGLLLYNIQLS